MSVLLAKTLRSKTFQLALLSIAGFGAIVVVLFGYVYWATETYVLSRADRMIVSEQAALRKIYDRAGRNGLRAAITQRVTDEASAGGIYLLTDENNQPIAGNLAAWPAAMGANGWGNFTASEPDSHAPLVRAAFATLPDRAHLLVGKTIEDLNSFTKEMGAALASTLLLIFLLAGVASLFVTRRTVGRIEAINATSRAIMERGLDRRIALRGTRDEWDHLAENLNLMLDRIETLMQEVRQVTDNVAHDLRTPLARMRGRLEKAADRARESSYDQQLIGDMIADLDDVLRVFSSLMRISQIEASDRTAGFRTVNLAEIAREVVELFDAAAEEKGMRLSMMGEDRVFATGDRDLLFDAMANLVDNAIKHGHQAGQVSVTIAATDGGAMVTVVDDGPGIPADELPNVFKRFYRLERSRCSPGNGLGLSLVAAVARLHGAHIAIEDNRPGLVFRLIVPWTANAESLEKSALATLTPVPPRC